MRFVFIVLFLSPSFILFAQFTDLVQINGESSAYFRGDDAYKIIGNEVYLVYCESSTNNLIFSYSTDGQEFSNTLIDNNLYYSDNATPTIEILPDGKIVIFYVKELDWTLDIYQAVSIDNGASFEIELLENSVSEFTSCTDENTLYISYKECGTKNFSEFNYYTNTEKSEYSFQGIDIQKFWGPDVLQGPVHSNGDIWIQHAGGGSNNGRPTFYGLVTTAGRAMAFPGGQPYKDAYPAQWQEVFRGGLEENTGPVLLPDNNEALVNNSFAVGDGYDIVYVKMSGTICETMLGYIIYPGYEDFDVHSWFPHNDYTASTIIANGGNWYEDSDLIAQNHLVIPDTIWTAGPVFTMQNNSFWVEDAVLWIEGQVSGSTTWGCANEIYITSDITYTHTMFGDFPDGFSGYDPQTGQPLYEGSINETDYFGLVSDEKIIIKYKHKDPFNDMALRDDNCDGIYLYGAYAATAFGDPAIYGTNACLYDGIFSFEYQHPHGSTPNFTAQSPYTLLDTTYTYVDLQKYVFPIDLNLPAEILGFNLHSNEPVTYNLPSGFPYESDEYLNSFPNDDPGNYVFPYGTDYPWYNPVWPESAEEIFFERGSINLFGSLVQRRRGYTHRSGSDPRNHHPDNMWDLENHYYGGDHPSTGYEKNYYYDNRFQLIHPIHFPEGFCEPENPIFTIARSSDSGETFDVLNTIPFANTEKIFQIVAEDNIIAEIAQTATVVQIHLSTNNGNYFALESIPMSYGVLKNIEICDELIYMYFHRRNNENNIVILNPETLQTQMFQTFEPAEPFSNFAISHNHEKVYVSFIDYSFSSHLLEMEFQYTNQSSAFNNVYNWQSTYYDFIYHDISNVYLNFNQNDFVYPVILEKTVPTQSYGNIHIAKDFLPDLTTESWNNEIPANQKPTLSNYPNPFNPSTTISFSLYTEITEDAELVIYNLKGQKVKNLSPSLHSLSSRAESRDEVRGENQYNIVWNGTDDSGKPASSGIYFYKLKSGDYQKTNKMLLMK
jgi:hypothetical protein